MKCRCCNNSGTWFAGVVSVIASNAFLPSHRENYNNRTFVLVFDDPSNHASFGNGNRALSAIVDCLVRSIGSLMTLFCRSMLCYKRTCTVL